MMKSLYNQLLLFPERAENLGQFASYAGLKDYLLDKVSRYALLLEST